VKNCQNRRKTSSDGYNFHIMWEIDVAESIFDEIFVIGSRINVLTGHAQTLLSQKSPKMMLLPRSDRLYGKMGMLNSNMTSDFKLEVVIW